MFHTSLLEISSGSPKISLILHPALANDTDDYLDDLIESKIEAYAHPIIEKKILSLDQLIIKSILALDTLDAKKKMANCILLTGEREAAPGAPELRGGYMNDFLKSSVFE